MAHAQDQLSIDSDTAIVQDATMAVIVLNYNGYEDTVECIEGIRAHDGISAIIVDNLSPDGSGNRLAEKYKDDGSVYYVDARSNRGYAGGNNIGVKYAMSSLPKRPSYICVLNNDTVLTDEPLWKMAHYLDCNPQCGIVGPVVLENQREQVIQSAGAGINLWTGNVGGWHHGESYEPSDDVLNCQYISGACMMFRSEDYERLGDIPECYFLFFEETEWCLRATRMGYTVDCLLSAHIVHKGSASVSDMGDLGRYLMCRNRGLFEKRNAGLLQKLYFRARYMAKCLAKHFLSGEDCMWELRAMIDGFNGKVKSEYENLFFEAS